MPVKPLEEQVERIIGALPAQHRVVFLAGVRFAIGFEQYGDELERMSDADLAMATLEEQADQYVYTAERLARHDEKHRKCDCTRKVCDCPAGVRR